MYKRKSKIVYFLPGEGEKPAAISSSRFWLALNLPLGSKLALLVSHHVSETGGLAVVRWGFPLTIVMPCAANVSYIVDLPRNEHTLFFKAEEVIELVLRRLQAAEACELQLRYDGAIVKPASFGDLQRDIERRHAGVGGSLLLGPPPKDRLTRSSTSECVG